MFTVAIFTNILVSFVLDFVSECKLKIKLNGLLQKPIKNNENLIAVRCVNHRLQMELIFGFEKTFQESVRDMEW